MLDAADVPKATRTAVVCEETGRTRQAVVCWFPSPTNKQPGCPDLESFAALCIRFGLDANWLLGITESRYSLPKDVAAEEPAQCALRLADYYARLERELARNAPRHELFTMAGVRWSRASVTAP